MGLVESLQHVSYRIQGCFFAAVFRIQFPYVCIKGSGSFSSVPQTAVKVNSRLVALAPRSEVLRNEEAAVPPLAARGHSCSCLFSPRVEVDLNVHEPHLNSCQACQDELTSVLMGRLGPLRVHGCAYGICLRRPRGGVMH